MELFLSIIGAVTLAIISTFALGALVLHFAVGEIPEDPERLIRRRNII